MKRRHPLLAFAAVLLGLAALLPTASTASAAPPDNDDISGATVLGPVPFHLEQDTTEATTSAEEVAFNDFCGAPALEQGVWFTATAPADNYVVADVTASDFSAGILVLTGEPGNLTPLTCQPGMVSGPVVAGETIYLVVFGDGIGETSGHLVLDTYLAPEPPAIDVTIDPRGTVDKAGLVHVSGPVTCTSDDPEGILFDVSGNISQRVGRGSVDGFFGSEQFTPCDGVTRPWSAEAFAESGKFAGGKAATVTFAFGCDTFSCGEGYVEATIQLSRSGK
jgi:hypothetical protein